MKKIGHKHRYILRDNVVGSATDTLRAAHGNVWGAENNVIKINAKTRITSKDRLQQIPFQFKDENTILKPDNIAVTTSKKYLDFNFDISAPFVLADEENTGIKNNSAATKLEIDSFFNFYNHKFSTFAETTGIDELDLPNFYILLNRDIKTTDDIEQIVTNGYRIDDALLGDPSSAKEYFTKYAETFSFWASSYRLGYKERLRRIIFDTNEVDKLLSGNEKTKVFGNYIKIDLYKDKSGAVSRALSETKLDLKLISHLIDNAATTNKLIFLAEKRNLASKPNSPKINVSSASNPQVYLSVKNESVKYIDFSSWLKQLNANTTSDLKYFDFTGAANGLYLGTRSNENVPSAQDSSFLNSLMPKVLLGKINKLAKNNTRTYKDITDGKSCYTEVLGYRLEKKKVGSGVVQEFYFQNNESDLLRFIDTQTIKDSTYTYNLFYYVFVIGSEYSYIDSGKRLEVKSDPLMYIFEIEAASASIMPKIELAPPIAPIITPIPYKEINNKIKFNLKQGIDSYYGEFIKLLPEDDAILNRILLSQKKKDEKNIHFQTSTAGPERYEVYRLLEPPKSYADFSRKLLKILENDSFADILDVNQKYYYMVRSVSQSGLKSNPSIVYEIELVLNSGAHYPIIRVFEFPKQDETQKTISFKKRLRIEPSLNQFIGGNMDYSVATTTPNLGVGPRIWDKNYKVRLTSKQTGRKLDINFKMFYGAYEYIVAPLLFEDECFENSLDFSIYCNSQYVILF